MPVFLDDIHDIVFSLSSPVAFSTLTALKGTGGRWNNNVFLVFKYIVLF